MTVLCNGNSSTTRRRARSPIDLAFLGSLHNSAKADAIRSGEAAGTSRPVSPSVSRLPPTSVATTGREKHIYSSKAFDIPSSCEARIPISENARISLTLGLDPRKTNWSRTPALTALISSSCCIPLSRPTNSIFSRRPPPIILLIFNDLQRRNNISMPFIRY